MGERDQRRRRHPVLGVAWLLLFPLVVLAGLALAGANLGVHPVPWTVGDLGFKPHLT
jgi:hypothetical protein